MLKDWTETRLCHFGDCRESMAAMIAAGMKVQTVVTSPPYWALRDYGTSPVIFTRQPECKHSWGNTTRVRKGGSPVHGSTSEFLGRPDGAAQDAAKRFESGQFCWDCGGWRGHVGLEAVHDCMAWAQGLEPCTSCWVCHMREIFGLVFELLADDGTLWLNIGDSYAAGGRGGNPTKETSGLRGGQECQDANMVRRSIKPPPGLKRKDLCGMPYRLAMALQVDGWYWRAPIVWYKRNAMPESCTDRPTTAHEYLWLMSKREKYFYDAAAIREPVTGGAHARGTGVNPKGMPGVSGWMSGPGAHDGLAGRYPKARQNDSFSAAVCELVDERNKRSVWDVPTQAYSGAHFATFPEKLIEPCILAGSRGGSIVFDPFMGSGTVADVAQRLGREWIGCELDEKCRALQAERIVPQMAVAI